MRATISSGSAPRGWRSWAAPKRSVVRRLSCVWALCAALASPALSQSLDEARAAFASGLRDEASRLAEPLAAAGQAEALALLGLIARDSVPPETERARTLLETAAASGAPTALNALGRAYQSGGLGLPRDTARALDHYERAVWINPVREGTWDWTSSIEMLRRMMRGRMVPLTLEGLERATGLLRA